MMMDALAFIADAVCKALSQFSSDPASKSAHRPPPICAHTHTQEKKCPYVNASSPIHFTNTTKLTVKGTCTHFVNINYSDLVMCAPEGEMDI